MKLGVFASGQGSNFSAIVTACQQKHVLATVELVICDRPTAYVIQRAKLVDIPVVVIEPQVFESRLLYEEAILAILSQYQIEMIVLAGYLRVIGPTLLTAYPQKIINIHPSLLPAFPGLHGIRDALVAGVKETGVTIHFIDEGIDTGPIIAQEKIKVAPDETLASLAKKIHQVEHRLYPQVLAALVLEKN